MDLAKVDPILNWPALRNVKDVQSFLGFANFYRRFIYEFSRLATPLTELTRKFAKFIWDEKCEEAFNTSQTRTRMIATNKFVDRMQELQLHLHDEMLVAQAIYESWANKCRKPCPRYSVGYWSRQDNSH